MTTGTFVEPFPAVRLSMLHMKHTHFVVFEMNSDCFAEVFHVFSLWLLNRC